MGGKEVISLKQVLAMMAAAVEPFALRFVKFNEAKGTGGEIVELGGQLLSNRGTVTAPESAPAIGPGPESVDELEAHLTRNPNHFDNRTRNLVSMLNGNFTKVHIYLILEFNGKKVII
jgi:hypothetical protein